MRRCAAAALLLLALCGSVAAKDKWTNVRSKNFNLVGNASEKQIRQVATRLEQFRDVFSKLLTNTKFASSTPTTVVVFKSQSNYQRFAPPNSAGYFIGADDMSYIVLSSDMSGDNPYSTIFHEFVHLMVKSNLSNVPLWFNEGLAEYYSTFELTDDEQKVRLGRVIPNHVFYLREKRLIPFQTLFNVDHSSPLYNERDKKGVFYAESWALVHYLLLNPKREPQLSVFFNLLTSGIPPDVAFPQAFQTDYATLENDLKNYVGRTTYPYQVVTFKSKLEFDLEMQTTPLSDAEGEFYQGDLLNHVGRLEDAEKHLKEAITLDQKLGIAFASLGMLEMRRGRFDEARGYLEQATAAGSQNYLVHYYFATILSRAAFGSGRRMVTGISGELARKIRAELQKTIELQPTFAEAYRLLGFVNLVEGVQLEESVALLKRAIALAPGDQEFAFLLAQIYLRMEDLKLARATLEPLATGAYDAELRDRSKSMLDEINLLERQPNPVLRDRSSASSIVEADPNVTVDEPDDPATEAERMNAALQSVLRRPEEGEERVRGQLVRIECNSSGNVTFHVSVGDRLYKLSASSFNQVRLVAYTDAAGKQVKCGSYKPALEVVATFKKTKESGSKVEGGAVAIEMVPAEFKLK